MSILSSAKCLRAICLHPRVLKFTLTKCTVHNMTTQSAREIISAKCGDIHYEKTGIGKHHVLFLPGMLGCSQTDFLYQMEHFNNTDFTLIFWDPPGYGRSIPPDRTWPDAFYERDAHAAIKFMAKMHIEKFSMVGWSDGGITALLAAAFYPEKIHKLVSFAGQAALDKKDVETWVHLKNITNWSPRMLQPMLDVYGETYFKKHLELCIDSFAWYWEKRNGDLCTQELSKIQCPTLIIHGEKDAGVPPSCAKFLHEKITHSELVMFPDGKHNLHLKYYKEFNEMVEKFLLKPITISNM